MLQCITLSIPLSHLFIDAVLSINLSLSVSLSLSFSLSTPPSLKCCDTVTVHITLPYYIYIPLSIPLPHLLIYGRGNPGPHHLSGPEMISNTWASVGAPPAPWTPFIAFSLKCCEGAAQCRRPAPLHQSLFPYYSNHYSPATVIIVPLLH